MDIFTTFPLFAERIKDKKLSTEKKYMQELNAFVRFLESKDVEAKTVLSDVEQLKYYAQVYKNLLKENGVSDSRINVVVSALKCFGEEQHNVDIGLKTERKIESEEEKEEEDFIKKEEFLKVLTRFENNEKYSLIYCFLLVTGMRPSMLENRLNEIQIGKTNTITWDQIELVTHNGVEFATIYVRKRQNKGNHPYRTFVTPEVWEALKRYRLVYDEVNKITYDDSKPIFPLVTYSNLKSKWEDAVDEVGLRERLPNNFRRAHLYTVRKLFSSLLSGAGVPDNFVDFFMGQMPSLRARYRRHIQLSKEESIVQYAKAIEKLTLGIPEKLFIS